MNIEDLIDTMRMLALRHHGTGSGIQNEAAGDDLMATMAELPRREWPVDPDDRCHDAIRDALAEMTDTQLQTLATVSKHAWNSDRIGASLNHAATVTGVSRSTLRGTWQAAALRVAAAGLAAVSSQRSPTTREECLDTVDRAAAAFLPSVAIGTWRLRFRRDKEVQAVRFVVNDMQWRQTTVRTWHAAVASTRDAIDADAWIDAMRLLTACTIAPAIDAFEPESAHRLANAAPVESVDPFDRQVYTAAAAARIREAATGRLLDAYAIAIHQATNAGIDGDRMMSAAAAVAAGRPEDAVWSAP